MLPFNPRSRTHIKDVTEQRKEKNIFTWDIREMEQIIYCEIFKIYIHLIQSGVWIKKYNRTTKKLLITVSMK
jgi:hypothetical protein